MQIVEFDVTISAVRTRSAGVSGGVATASGDGLLEISRVCAAFDPAVSCSTRQDVRMVPPAQVRDVVTGTPSDPGAGRARVTVARDWSVLDVDRAAESILGEFAAALVGRPVWEVFSDPRELDLGAALEKAMRVGTFETGEDFHPALGVWLAWEIVPDVAGLVVSLVDVTSDHIGDPRAIAALTRLTLLGRVSEALTSTDDPDEAVGRLARLVLPHLGDWSFITVIEDDGQLRDLGIAHRDPRRYDDLAAYSARHLDEMTETAAVWRALHGTTHVVVPAMSPQILAAFIPDPAAFELTRRLDPFGVASFPLVARGRTFGALTVVNTSARGSHSAEQIATGLEVARRAAPVLEAARAAQRARNLAESMQRSVLSLAPHGTHVATAVRYRPASRDRQVGGDWYDAFDLPNGATVLTMGDVMGHDVAATAAMSQLRTLVRGAAWISGGSPAEVLGAVDRAAVGLGLDTFATAFTAELAPPAADGTVRVTSSNAGHPPPLVLRHRGEIELLGDGSPDIPLGVLPSAPRRDAVATLHPGDVLFLYTDGLIERRDRDIDIGLADLTEVLRHADRLDVESLLDAVLTALTADGAGDDIALLAARIRSHDEAAAPGTAPVTHVESTSVRVPADAIAPAIGRDQIRRHGGHLAPDRLADAELLVSELLGNAIRHGSAPIVLQLDVTSRDLHVGVSDSGSGRPVVRISRPDDTATGGRGLLITAALASTWGVQPAADGPGKTVWFTVDAPRS